MATLCIAGIVCDIIVFVLWYKCRFGGSRLYTRAETDDLTNKVPI